MTILYRLLPVALVAVVLLGGCASSVTSDLGEFQADGSAESKTALQSIADRIVEVSEADRPVRACLFTAIGVELIAQRVARFDVEGVDEAMGRAIRLQSIAMAARNRSMTGLWINADMADVGLDFGALLKDLAKERIVDYLTAGLSIQTVVGAVERASVQSLKAAAMIADIRAMFAKRAVGQITVDDIWNACDERVAVWIARLRAISSPALVGPG